MTSANGRGKTCFAGRWQCVSQSPDILAPKCLLGWCKWRALLVGWGRNDDGGSGSTRGWHCCVWRLNALLSSKGSPSLVFHSPCVSHRHQNHLSLCLWHRGSSPLPLLSKAYSHKNEYFLVKLIQPFVCSFRRMFFILCWEMQSLDCM